MCCIGRRFFWKFFFDFILTSFTSRHIHFGAKWANEQHSILPPLNYVAETKLEIKKQQQTKISVFYRHIFEVHLKNNKNNNKTVEIIDLNENQNWQKSCCVRCAIVCEWVNEINYLFPDAKTHQFKWMKINWKKKRSKKNKFAHWIPCKVSRFLFAVTHSESEWTEWINAEKTANTALWI